MKWERLPAACRHFRKTGIFAASIFFGLAWIVRIHASPEDSGVRAGSGTRLGAGVHEAAQSRLAEAYGKLPLSFEANQGQFGPKVKFASRNRGYSLFLTPTEAVLSLRDDRADAEPTAAGQAAAAGKAVSQASGPASALVRMKLAGSGADPKSIRFGLEGGGALKLDAQGDLVLGETGREIRFRKPSLYQQQGGKK